MTDIGPILQDIWLKFTRDPEVLGLLPSLLSSDDPRPAAEQMASSPCGWLPFGGATLRWDDLTLHYPGDPPYRALAITRIRNERIILFEHELLAIIQPDGGFEVSRVS